MESCLDHTDEVMENWMDEENDGLGGGRKSSFRLD
jgi:hypothetical protein